MGLLDNRELPEALAGALEAVVDRIPPEALAAAAAGIPEFATGGFRVAGAKPGTLRRRAVQLLRSKGPVPDSLRRLACAHSLQASVVGLLSEEVLARRCEELAEMFGPGDLLLALALDARAPVRELAAQKAAAPGHVATVPANPVAERKAVERVFGGLLEALAPVLGRLAEQEAVSGEAATPGLARSKDDRDRLARMETELREARERAARVAGLEAKVAKLEAAGKELRTEAARRQALSQSHEKAIADAQARGDHWRDEALRLEQTLAERVAAEVENRLADEAFGWLREARELKRAAEAEGAADDLETRVRRSLERQREADRRYGSLTTLRARLGRLTEAQDEVRKARTDALNPLSELAALERELEDAIAKLERMPGVGAGHGETPLAQAFLARWADADDETAAELAELVPRLTRLKLLGANDAGTLANAQKRRLAVRLAHDHGPAPAKDHAEGSAFTRLWRKWSGGPGPALLLLDGHNVLLRAEGRYAARLGAGGEPGGAARSALAQDADRVAQAVAGTEARLFFDGPEAAEHAHSPRVLVVFSGGKGTDRADARIEGYLRFRKGRQTPARVLLVTDDGGLAARAHDALRSVMRLSVRQWEDLASAASTVR